MKKFIVTFATAVALINPGVALANFGPDGTHVFEGDVDVIKNLPIPTACTLTVTVVVAGGGTTATATPVLSGATLCNAIQARAGTFASAPYTVTGSSVVGGYYTAISLGGVEIQIPPVAFFPADGCLGNLAAAAQLSPGSRTITLTTPTSDVTDGNPDNFGGTENPCKIEGVLYEI